MTLYERRQGVQRAIEVMTEWVSNEKDTSPASTHMGRLLAEGNDDKESALFMLGSMISLCGYALIECAESGGTTETQVLQSIAHRIAVAQAAEGQ